MLEELDQLVGELGGGRGSAQVTGADIGLGQDRGDRVRMSLAAARWPRCSSIMAADQIAPSGLAMPWPATPSAGIMAPSPQVPLARPVVPYRTG
jgi:hypothetical protein